MIEDKAKRTATQRVYDLGDGRLRAEIGAYDINYLNHDGRGDGAPGWRKIDINPTETPEGWVQEFCHYRMVAPLTADGVAAYTQTWGDSKIKNRMVTFQAVGAAPVHGMRGMVGAAQAVIYPNAFGDGQDLVYCFYVSGIGKFVRVRAGATGSAYQFKVGTSDKLERMGQNGYEILRTGKKTLDTRRMTAIGGDTYLRPITARWGDYSETLPVEIEPTTGGWIITKATPASWDGSDDLYMDLTTTGTLAAATNSCILLSYSAASQSQANWDAAHDNTTGTQVDNGATSDCVITSYYRSATSLGYRIWRGYFAWSLAIPGAVISAADITVNVSNALRGDSVHACAGTQASTTTLATSDFPAAGNTSFGSVAFNATGNKTITLNASGIAHINVNGDTKFSLRQDVDINDTYPQPTNTGSGYVSAVGSYESGTAPILNITYTIPATGGVPSGLMLLGIG